MIRDFMNRATMLVEFLLCSWWVMEGSAAAVITPGTSLTPSSNESWISSNGTFAMGFFSSTPDLHYCGVFYMEAPPSRSVSSVVTWIANRNQPASSNSSLEFTADGNLVLSDSGRLIWQSGTANQGIEEAEMLDDGNFVLRSSNGSETIWESFNFPTDTLLPGQKLLPGQNLTAWATRRDPRSSNFFLLLDSGLWKLRLLYRLLEYWSEGSKGPAQLQFSPSSGSVGLYRNGNSTADWILNSTYCDVFASQFRDNSRRLRLDPDGNLRYYVRSPASNDWKVIWRALYSPCFVYNICGDNGICDWDAPVKDAVCPLVDQDPPCSCPEGYAYADSTETQRGCQPITKLECSTSFFQRYNNTVFEKLAPEKTANYINISEQSCLDRCQNDDCACNAAVYGSSQCWLLSSSLVNGSKYAGVGKVVYVRTPLNNTSTGSSSGISTRAKVGLGTAAGVVLLLVVSLLLGYKIMRRLRKQKILRSGITSSSQESLFQYCYDYLRYITDNFKRNLGRGGFGVVYLGIPPEGERVAVKVLNEAQEDDKSFMAEVESLGSMHHVNIVSLLGFCMEKNKRILVYEYVENMSLDKVLFTSVLDWPTRVQILIGAAKGIEYFHIYSGKKIVHRDIKPANILLDASYNAKVADFGLAKMIAMDETHTTNLSLAGTIGYAAPECSIIGDAVTVQADVYSFGVVLVEVVAGRKLVFVSMQSISQGLRRTLLFKNATQCMRDDKYLEIVDERLEWNFDEEQAMRFVKVAGWCLQENPKERPTMEEVVTMLKGDRPVDMPPFEGLPSYITENLES